MHVKQIKHQHSGRCKLFVLFLKTGPAGASQEPRGSLAALMRCHLFLKQMKIYTQVRTCLKPMKQSTIQLPQMRYVGETI